jgi:hypothetical protein
VSAAVLQLRDLGGEDAGNGQPSLPCPTAAAAAQVAQGSVLLPADDASCTGHPTQDEVRALLIYLYICVIVSHCATPSILLPPYLHQLLVLDSCTSMIVLSCCFSELQLHHCNHSWFVVTTLYRDLYGA